MAAASSRSANVAELRRMFSNLDSSIIESVLSANNGQLDATIDHLLTMSTDAENEHNIQQVTTPPRQLPAVPNIYDDDPPPYPGHDATNSHHTTNMLPLPQRSSVSPYSQSTNDRKESNNGHLSDSTNNQPDLQVRKWKTSYGQYRHCYIGDLPDNFLRAQKTNPYGEHNNGSTYSDEERLSVLFQNEDFLNELRQNKDFITTLHSDQSTRATPSSSQQRRSSHHISTKPLPIPTPPTVEVPKTPKVRARMLQNVLTQIEHGQTTKTSMVPEESITHDEGYSYGKDNREPMPLPPAPYISEFDPLRSESNEEFIGRLKNMGKNSMEKFNQLARRFSMRKDTTNNIGKYSKQPWIQNTID